MSYPKAPPGEKKLGVCGCVTKRVKDRLIAESANRGKTIGVVVGELLTQWCDEQVELEGEVVYLPYRHEQDEKKKREGHGYRGGLLGKEKRESVIVRRGRGN